MQKQNIQPQPELNQNTDNPEETNILNMTTDYAAENLQYPENSTSFDRRHIDENVIIDLRMTATLNTKPSTGMCTKESSEEVWNPAFTEPATKTYSDRDSISTSDNAHTPTKESCDTGNLFDNELKGGNGKQNTKVNHGTKNDFDGKTVSEGQMYIHPLITSSLFGERNQIGETSVEKPNSDSGMTADNSCYQTWNNSTKSENKDIENKDRPLMSYNKEQDNNRLRSELEKMTQIDGIRSGGLFQYGEGPGGLYLGQLPYSLNTGLAQYRHIQGSGNLQEETGMSERCTSQNKSINNNKLNGSGGTDSTVDVRPHVCTTCGKGFNRKDTLQCHIRTHTGEKPYVCSECNKAFTELRQLQIHTRIHTREMPYTCTLCSRGFRQSAHLKAHLTSHTGDKPHMCTICSKSFSRNSTLQNHIRRHNGDKRYTCTVCFKGFIQSNDLTRHMPVHTGELPYKCTSCEKGFTQKCDLKAHLTTHSGEKPYICSTCGKGFNRSCHLLTHMRTHTGEKPHMCNTCGKGFIQKNNLTQHMKIHIRGEKSHICNTCGKRFNYSCSLKVHEQKHHNMHKE